MFWTMKPELRQKDSLENPLLQWEKCNRLIISSEFITGSYFKCSHSSWLVKKNILSKVDLYSGQRWLQEVKP